MAGSTASVTANRVTVCLTWQQRTYIQAGASRFRIGFSEYLRRILDQMMYGENTGLDEKNK